MFKIAGNLNSLPYFFRNLDIDTQFALPKLKETIQLVFPILGSHSQAAFYLNIFCSSLRFTSQARNLDFENLNFSNLNSGYLYSSMSFISLVCSPLRLFHHGIPLTNIQDLLMNLEKIFHDDNRFENGLSLLETCSYLAGTFEFYSTAGKKVELTILSLAIHAVVEGIFVHISFKKKDHFTAFCHLTTLSTRIGQLFYYHFYDRFRGKNDTPQ
ncbi:MAG: hypothetical protein L0207_06305 [Chlamydiae bacterium]|nr:hypothetical protein [Chlamydiota bacterium]